MIVNPSLDFNATGNILGLTSDEFHALRHLSKLVHITGTGVLDANLLQWLGTIQIISQYAVLETVTTLTNGTDVYATIEDGGSSPLTKTPGAVISGFEVGSFFLKDLIATSVYSTMQGDQARVNETSGVKAGSPFIINAQRGVNNYIAFHMTTTDAPVDFWMKVHFEYRRLSDDANLFFL